MSDGDWFTPKCMKVVGQRNAPTAMVGRACTTQTSSTHPANHAEHDRSSGRLRDSFPAPSSWRCAG